MTQTIQNVELSNQMNITKESVFQTENQSFEILLSGDGLKDSWKAILADADKETSLFASKKIELVKMFLNQLHLSEYKIEQHNDLSLHSFIFQKEDEKYIFFIERYSDMEKFYSPFGCYIKQEYENSNHMMNYVAKLLSRYQSFIENHFSMTP